MSKNDVVVNPGGKLKLAAIDPKKWLSEGHRSATARRAKAQALRSMPECWHMAGRAVTAAALGVRFGSVRVSGERGYFVGMPRVGSRNLDRALVAASGALAESFYSHGDGDGFTNRLYGLHSFSDVIKLLREYRHFLEAIAVDLHKRGELTESDVLAHFRSGPRKRGKGDE